MTLLNKHQRESLETCSRSVTNGETSDPQRNPAANGLTQTAKRFVSRLLAFLAYLLRLLALFTLLPNLSVANHIGRDPFVTGHVPNRRRLK